jgi:alkylhydroperoxidase family enzyme
VIEAASVVAGFNFANRVADALDVEHEIPRWFDGHPRSRALAMGLMSSAMRLRMRFRPQGIPARAPDIVLAELKLRFDREHMGRPPKYLEHLRSKDYMLEQHARLQTSLMLESGVPRRLIKGIGLIISSLNGDKAWASDWRALLENDPSLRGIANELTAGVLDAWPAAGERLALKLARTITLNASETTDRDIALLKEQGRTDHDVLAVVLVAAGFNAGNRLNIALSSAISSQHSSLSGTTYPQRLPPARARTPIAPHSHSESR